MRLTTARKLSQIFFLALFLFLILVTDFTHIRGYPASLFLQIDPLVAAATALGARTLYSGMILSLLVAIPTIFLGRFFCGWVCPLGTLNGFFGRVLGKRPVQDRIAANRYQRVFALKYYVLVVFLVLSVFGVTQIGLMDPISFLTRAVSTSVLPAVGFATGGRAASERIFVHGWVSGGLLIAVLLANAAIPRFYCRALCPLGALLGAISRLSLFHVRRSEAKCTQCDRCAAACPGASDPHRRLRKAECYVCMECREVCPTHAISFEVTPPESETLPRPDVSRRRILETAVIAAAAFPILRAAGSKERLPSPSLIRPPGSQSEKDFLATCVKCGECMKVCPTNVIQPALLEGGIEGVWTPVMVNRIGYCERTCTLCGSVCPTGAIREFSLAEKLGGEDHEKPIKLGTAFVDRTRCLPWAMNIPCIVCEEMCPVSPKAIYLERAEVVDSSGKSLVVQRPVVDPARCIGCGLCENKCPVHDRRAIRVTSVGESRSDSNVLLLR